MLKPTKKKLLLTQSIQEKYSIVLQEPSINRILEFHWRPFISLQMCDKVPDCIPTQDVFISSAKTLDFLDFSMLEGKNIYVVGESTALTIQQLGKGPVLEVYQSATEANFSRPCTFIGAAQPTKIVQEKIEIGELLHFPLYDRIEHRNHIIPQDIEWVVFLSPSAVTIWFEAYHGTKNADVKYAVIGETTNHQLKKYKADCAIMPSQPNFKLLLEEIASMV